MCAYRSVCAYKDEWCVMYYKNNEPVHENSNNEVCATSKDSNQPAHTRSL